MRRVQLAAFNLKRKFSQRISAGAVRAGTLGLVDQTILSGVNFLFMIAAARLLGPSAFGLFAILFMLLGIVEAFQTSLVTSPHNVFGATKTGQDYRRYTGAVVSIQLLLVVLVAVLLSIAAMIALRFNAVLGAMMFALVFAATGFQLQEFVRRVLYTESRVGAALFNDTVTNGLRVMLLGVLVVSGGLSGSSLFLVIGASCLAGAVLGFWQIRRSVTPAFDTIVVREHWQFGGWLCAGRMFSHAPRYVTAAVLSAVLSLGAFGAYRAAYQLVHATNVPLNALDSLLRPRLARDAANGPSAVWRTLTPLMVAGGVAFLVFAGVLIVLREPLMEYIYGPEFAAYAAVMFVLAFRPLATLPERLYTNALQSVRFTRPFFTAKVVGAIAGTAAGSAMVLIFGLPAAGVIAVLTTSVSVTWLAVTWKRHMESEKSWVSKARKPLPESPIMQRQS